MTCRKIKHLSTHGAAMHILSLFKAGKGMGRTMGIYYCGKCDGYHITRRADRRCIAKIK